MFLLTVRATFSFVIVTIEASFYPPLVWYICIVWVINLRFANYDLYRLIIAALVFT